MYFQRVNIEANDSCQDLFCFQTNIMKSLASVKYKLLCDTIFAMSYWQEQSKQNDISQNSFIKDKELPNAFYRKINILNKVIIKVLTPNNGSYNGVDGH